MGRACGTNGRNAYNILARILTHDGWEKNTYRLGIKIAI
jgi:hypothetical protein